LTNGTRFHRLKIKIKLNNSGEEFYGFRQIIGVNEEVGFKKEGEKRRTREAPKIF
jgi:hypothetical protein